jgi:hypothetical protein
MITEVIQRKLQRFYKQCKTNIKVHIYKHCNKKIKVFPENETNHRRPHAAMLFPPPDQKADEKEQHEAGHNRNDEEEGEYAAQNSIPASTFSNDSGVDLHKQQRPARRLSDMFPAYSKKKRGGANHTPPLKFIYISSIMVDDTHTTASTSIPVSRAMVDISAMLSMVSTGRRDSCSPSVTTEQGPHLLSGAYDKNSIYEELSSSSDEKSFKEEYEESYFKTVICIPPCATTSGSNFLWL